MSILRSSQEINMMNREEILEVIKEANRPVALRELARGLKVKEKDKRKLKALVSELLIEGALVKTKEQMIGLPKKMDLVTGKVSCHRDGYAFVIPEEGEGDVYIPPRHLREVMHGDKVLVRVEHVKKDGKKEGKVVRILERGLVSVVGRFEAEKGHGYVIPTEQKILQDILIPKGQAGKAKDGQIVVAEIISYPTAHRIAEGRVIEVLGNPSDPDVEAMTIVRKYGIPYEFPEDALNEARKVPQDVDMEEIKNRVDLRGMNTVTIDGERAKDFDDAVAVKKERSGNIRLWVSIADVSHYVREGSPLDREAYLRSTSTYFPDRAIPMLPEELSNGICSLNPKVDRLTMTAEMAFDKSGRMVDCSFYQSIIHSVERLTYTAVRQVLVDKDKELIKRYKNIHKDLQVMEELCLRLREKRLKRGSIDFDLPEPQIILNIEGKTEDIIKAERNLAHQIIEEFMLAANEAVASHVSGLKLPFIYRVHEEPDEDEVMEFSEFVHNFGFTLKFKKGTGVSPMIYTKLLEDVKGRPEEKMINTVMLRSMKQARYSEENIGHFGLAAEFYTHFTSPIRRYPDLIVHRILKEAVVSGQQSVAGKGQGVGSRESGVGSGKSEAGSNLPTPNSQPRTHFWESHLPAMAIHTSKRERVSMEAEREIVDLKKVQFMQDRVGEEFDGLISGVTSFGFFVELVDYFVEGLVHVSNLKDDYYHFIEKEHLMRGESKKRTFRIGDQVKVRIDNVSLEKRQIDFSLVGEEMPARKPKSRKRG
ncbi:MAG: ribonuclease R [Deltaproteobacteria bacterium]|nr:ribonuclease R [Deltaproteobacteria bacterium]